MTMRRILFGATVGGTYAFFASNVRSLSSVVFADTYNTSVGNAEAISGPVDVLPQGAADRTFDYDLVVIGGGSGGLAASKRAAELGAKVAVCDYVTPSTQGTKWGLGGTCVNVGCIPKKLMHHSALFGFEGNTLAPCFGWTDGLVEKVCNWETLRENVVNHIRYLNFGYTVSLRSKDISYINSRATICPNDSHTVLFTDKGGEVKNMTARRILLATGGRPKVPEEHEVPGAKTHAITSDDLFHMVRDPGKTVVVGASYVALECAGFLHDIGRDVTLLVRSRPLRGFDEDMAERVLQQLIDIGVQVIRGVVPSEVSMVIQNTNGNNAINTGDNNITETNISAVGGEKGRKLKVCYGIPGEVQSIIEADTVLYAIGRSPDTSDFTKCGVLLDEKTKKVVTDRFDRTSIPHIYAIGDIVHGGLELTPVAIKSGKLLAERLFNKSTEVMSYNMVPTTIFTPIEYSCIGMSEKDANDVYGGDNIEVFHSHLAPLEWSLAYLGKHMCYAKLIVLKSTDKVIGFHLLAPRSGDIAQMAAVAMRCGATKADFDSTIGIHPTLAEGLLGMTSSKTAGDSPQMESC